MISAYLTNTLGLALDAAPWLLLGLAVAGLIKVWIPEQLLVRWLGGTGFLVVFRAALIGAPLPLCSCGAIPLGLALHRGGSSRGATTAFMVGTPGVGVDSVALTYALMGPLMAVIRPLAAIFSAVVSGLLVGLTSADGQPGPGEKTSPFPDRPPAAPSCSYSCGCRAESGSGPVFSSPAGETIIEQGGATASEGGWSSMLTGRRYSFSEVLDDIAWWLLLGLALAGLLLTLIPPGLLAHYAAGPAAMLLMALIGIPMYLCAQAATPVAAALIIAGVSPGTALVLLLAGPITSIATLSVFRNEFGSRAMLFYLVGVAGSAVFCGLVTDALISALALDLSAQIGAARELLPAALKYPALILLVLLAIRPLRRRFFLTVTQKTAEIIKSRPCPLSPISGWLRT